jgi:hypothetical protein
MSPNYSQPRTLNIWLVLSQMIMRRTENVSCSCLNKTACRLSLCYCIVDLASDLRSACHFRLAISGLRRWCTCHNYCPAIAFTLSA